MQIEEEEEAVAEMSEQMRGKHLDALWACLVDLNACIRGLKKDSGEVGKKPRYVGPRSYLESHV